MLLTFEHYIVFKIQQPWRGKTAYKIAFIPIFVYVLYYSLFIVYYSLKSFSFKFNEKKKMKTN